MHKQTPLLVASLLLGAASGCYNPDLGDNPYQCATDPDAPLCPIGYECQSGVCVKSSLLNQDGGSDGGFTGPDPSACPDKDLEPNESASLTAATPIGYGRVVNLAICGITLDKDYYKIYLKKMQSVRITLRYKPLGTGGKLDLTFFGQAASSPVTETDPDQSAESPEGRILTATPRFTGVKTEDWFFIKVAQAAMGGGQNFYELEVFPQK